MRFVPKFNFVPWLLFIIVALSFCLPLLKNIHFLGVEDWDEYFFRYGFARTTILEYGQFPLWNPYSCGGNVFLAHPTSAFLSPFFLFILFFGEVIGLKFLVVIFMVIGMAGMYFLSKYLNMRTPACYAAPLIFLLGSMFPLHAAGGLIGELTMVFTPFVFLFYLKSIDNPRYLIFAILANSLIFLGGSLRIIFIFSFFIFTYGLFLSLRYQKIKYFLYVTLIVAGTFLLCGIKSIPVTDFFINHPRVRDDPTGISLNDLAMIFIHKFSTYDPALSKPFNDGGYDWYSCGAYIGIVPLLLALIGSVSNFKKHWPLLAVALVFLLTAMGNNSPINVWKVLNLLPGFSALHSPPRFLFGIFFIIAIFAGLGFDRVIFFFQNKKIWSMSAAFGIIFLIILDLFGNTVLLNNIFTVKLPDISKNSIFHQSNSQLDFLREDSDIYPRFLSNIGTVNAAEVDNIFPRGNVLPISAKNYRGEAFLLNGKGSIKSTVFSPNKIALNISIENEDVLIINQNYLKGWRISKKNKISDALNFNGLISSPVSAGEYSLVFYYYPVSLNIGILTSFITALLLGFFFINQKAVKVS